MTRKFLLWDNCYNLSAEICTTMWNFPTKIYSNIVKGVEEKKRKLGWKICRIWWGEATTGFSHWNNAFRTYEGQFRIRSKHYVSSARLQTTINKSKCISLAALRNFTASSHVTSALKHFFLFMPANIKSCRKLLLKKLV